MPKNKRARNDLSHRRESSRSWASSRGVPMTQGLSTQDQEASLPLQRTLSSARCSRSQEEQIKLSDKSWWIERVSLVRPKDLTSQTQAKADLKAWLTECLARAQVSHSTPRALEITRAKSLSSQIKRSSSMSISYFKTLKHSKTWPSLQMTTRVWAWRRRSRWYRK